MFKIGHLVLRKPLNNYWKLTINITSIVVLCLGYEYISYAQHVKNPEDTTIPSFTQMGEALVKVATPDRHHKIVLWEDSKASFTRYFIGFGVGVSLAVVIGVGMGCFPVIEAFFDWPVRMLAKVPATGVITIFFVIFGTDIEMFAALLGFGIAPLLILAIYQSVKYDVPDEYIYKAYSLGASNCEVVAKVVFPYVFPRILESARLQVSSTMVYLIAAELTLAGKGFGATMRVQSRLLDMATVFVYIAILSLSGFLIDQAINTIRKFWCPWFGDGK